MDNFTYLCTHALILFLTRLVKIEKFSSNHTETQNLSHGEYPHEMN